MIAAFAHMNYMLGKKEILQYDYNTQVWRRDDGAITMSLHNNVIARLWPDHMTLYSCGYHTALTRDRLNRLPDIVVWAENRIWYVSWMGADAIFEEGITLHESGKITTIDGEDCPVARFMRTVSPWQKISS